MHPGGFIKFTIAHDDDLTPLLLQLLFLRSHLVGTLVRGRVDAYTKYVGLDSVATT